MTGIMDVIDYSFANITLEQILEARYGGVMRYLSPPPNPKNWTAQQLADDRYADLWIGFIWETTQLRSLEGGIAGATDATRMNEMMDQLGVPDTVAAFWANDFPSITIDQVYDYAQEFKANSKRPPGAYGSQLLLEQLYNYGFIRYKWQVSTWNTGWTTTANIVQEANIPCRVAGGDHNTVRTPDWGAWPPPSAPPIPTPITGDELPMEFTFITNGEDWLWLGTERIFTRGSSGIVLEALKNGHQIVALGDQPTEFWTFVNNLAHNAGFTG